MRAGLALAAAILTVFIAPGQHGQAQQPSQFAADILHQRQPGDTISLTRGEASAAVHELLLLSATAATAKLGEQDSFMQDQHVRIAMPQALGEAHARLKPFGMGGPLDELELAVNRAAATAIRGLAPTLSETMARTPIEDPLAVLRADGADATRVLGEASRNALGGSLRPRMEQALADAGAGSLLEAAATRYAPAMLRSDMNEMLLQHATAGAVDGLFYYLAQEELAIRRDPGQRASDNLRRVFGG